MKYTYFLQLLNSKRVKKKLFLKKLARFLSKLVTKYPLYEYWSTRKTLARG